jgi:hypothetical protein
MRVEVFSGWVQLRDPELVPERLRRPVFMKSIQAATLVESDDDINENAMSFFSEFNDLLAVAMVSEWSFDSPITVDGLQDLPSKSYDDIREAVSPFISKLIPDFGVDVDPKADTDNLKESDGS